MASKRTINISTDGKFFTVTNSSGFIYYEGSVGNVEMQYTTNGYFSMLNASKGNFIIQNSYYGDVINGATTQPFASMSALQTYFQTNFFNEASGGAGTSSVLGTDFIGSGTSQDPVRLAKDTTPIPTSPNVITSGGVFTGLADKKVQLVPKILSVNGTAQNKDLILADTTNGSIVINLIVTPADKTAIGIKHVVQGNTSGVPNTVTINLTDGSKFNSSSGATTATLNLLNQGFTAVFNVALSLWIVENADLPLSQLDLRFNKLLLIANPQTANYTLAATDTYVRMTVASANTLTIPTNASVPFPIGTRIQIEQGGAGQTTITPAAGVTINSAGGLTKTRVQYSMVTLTKKETDTWLLTGDIA